MAVKDLFTQVIGRGGIKLRSDDAAYLELVDRWWNVLLPKIAPFLYIRGGNILMVQVRAQIGSACLPLKCPASLYKELGGCVKFLMLTKLSGYPGCKKVFFELKTGGRDIV